MAPLPLFPMNRLAYDGAIRVPMQCHGLVNKLFSKKRTGSSLVPTGAAGIGQSSDVSVPLINLKTPHKM